MINNNMLSFKQYVNEGVPPSVRHGPENLSWHRAKMNRDISINHRRSASNLFRGGFAATANHVPANVEKSRREKMIPPGADAHLTAAYQTGEALAFTYNHIKSFEKAVHGRSHNKAITHIHKALLSDNPMNHPFIRGIHHGLHGKPREKEKDVYSVYHRGHKLGSIIRNERYHKARTYTEKHNVGEKAATSWLIHGSKPGQYNPQSKTRQALRYSK